MNESSQSSEQQSGLLIFLLLCCAGVIALSVATWFYTAHKQKYAEPAAEIAVMTPAEREYLNNIHVHLVVVQQAENYAHQRQVILNGEVVNGGARAVGELQFSVQFLNKKNRVELRELREVLAPTQLGLGARETRSFNLVFEKVPVNWNELPPEVQVIHLRLLP